MGPDIRQSTEHPCKPRAEFIKSPMLTNCLTFNMDCKCRSKRVKKLTYMWLHANKNSEIKLTI